MQTSSYIGKPVISPGGDAYGYVTGVRLTRKFEKVSCIECADENEEEFFLPLRAVLACGDAIVAGKARLTSPTGPPSPVGKKAYSAEGRALGIISDVICGEKALLVIEGEGRTEVPYDFVQMGETVVVYDEPVKHHTAKRAPKSPSEPKSPPAREVPPLPMNRTNLLGKKVRRSVYDDRGMPIAVAGERITPAILSVARRSGRLLELAVNTITQL